MPHPPIITTVTKAAIAVALLGTSTIGSAQPVSVAGTWDLTWQTRKGPKREGQFVIVQQGSRITGEIRGRGSVKAGGAVSGSRFTLKGNRMAIPYRIDGRIIGDRMVGTIKVLSVTRSFTGSRR